MSNKEYDVHQTLEDFDAGVYMQKVTRALCEAAMAAVTHGKKANVTLSIDLTQIKKTHQVSVDHTLKYHRPTTHGKVSEENTTNSVMHVNQGGRLSIVPEAQAAMDFSDPEATRPHHYQDQE